MICVDCKPLQGKQYQQNPKYSTVKKLLYPASPGKGAAIFRNFPDIRMLCVMRILVSLAPSRTHLTQCATRYPVTFPLLHFKFPFHDYLYNMLDINCKKTQHQYLTLLNIVQCCIHLTELHTYFKGDHLHCSLP